MQWVDGGKTTSFFEFQRQSPARVHGDADGLRHLLADAGGLELLEGEAAAQTLLQVVLERRTSDHWAERLDRPRGNLR